MTTMSIHKSPPFSNPNDYITAHSRGGLFGNLVLDIIGIVEVKLHHGMKTGEKVKYYLE